MIGYLVDQNGQYVKRLEGTAGEILAQTPKDHATVGVAPPRSTDYWNGSAWVAVGNPPDYYYIFDYGLKVWKDLRDIKDVRTQKWEAIKLERNTFEYGGFTYLNMRFDSDYISQGRIVMAVVLGKPTAWTLADNRVVELTQVQIGELGQALGNHVDEAHERGRNARKALDEAQTIAEVEAVIY